GRGAGGPGGLRARGPGDPDRLAARRPRRRALSGRRADLDRQDAGAAAWRSPADQEGALPGRADRHRGRLRGLAACAAAARPVSGVLAHGEGRGGGHRQAARRPTARRAAAARSTAPDVRGDTAGSGACGAAAPEGVTPPAERLPKSRKTSEVSGPYG